MKKTLIAIALAAMMAPAWGAEVVSSNIVGYQKVTLQPGFNFVAPQFTAVGGGDLNLQSIRLDVSDNDATGTDNIQILNAAGATVATYYWMPSDMVESGVAGWVDGDDLADVSIANGYSVLVDSEEVESVTVAGEVKPSKSYIVAQDGFNFVGNSTPVPISLQDIQIDVADADAQGTDNIQILDADGATVATYYWMPSDMVDSGVAGWVDGDDLADVELAPGQGVLLDTTTGVTISLPTAINE